MVNSNAKALLHFKVDPVLKKIYEYDLVCDFAAGKCRKDRDFDL